MDATVDKTCDEYTFTVADEWVAAAHADVPSIIPPQRVSLLNPLPVPFFPLRFSYPPGSRPLADVPFPPPRRRPVSLS